jgi:glutamate-1-semialdehyde 2,1-aminomutase
MDMLIRSITARLERRLAPLVPLYEFGEDRFFDSDGAPPEVARLRRSACDRLGCLFQSRAPRTVALGDELERAVSDVQFTRRYAVPFQYSRFVVSRLKIGGLAASSDGVRVIDLDGRTDYDLSGSYGVNLFGYDFYKECIDAGMRRVDALGPVLGAFHPVVADNVRRLKAISGLDEVSFHMSGTEAVMQAVRLARFHTRRSHLVRFAGAYHGWWDDVLPGAGNPATVHRTFTLREMDARTLRVLERRRDIACVLVNPVQALHPNANAPGDGMLIASNRRARFDRAAYTAWLRDLRAACTKRSIPLIFDEVFVGFRLARGGAQEYFGVEADMVTYGKTVGGGLPIGVLCGLARYMKRFRDESPSDFCFARGTFNSHPYVMGAMNEFLRRLDEPPLRQSYVGLDDVWNTRVRELNARLVAERVPIWIENLVSIWTVCHAAPSRYNWMLQYYLRAEGLALSWIGSGRLIFSHNYTDADMAAVSDRIVAAARAMRDDGWWWYPAGMTDRGIRSRVLREMIAARLRMLVRKPSHAVSSEAIGSKSSPRMT